MNFFDAIILGIIEGITEFLPISSTGHLILTSEILKLQQTEFLKSFEIAIQLGAILAVAVLYWRSFFTSLETVKRIAAALIPTLVVGAVFYKLIKQWLGNDQIVLWALLVGGVFLILFEYWHKEKEGAHDDLENLPYKKAVLIGLAQSLSVIPGVSRAAATILGGLSLNLKRTTIVEFSFLLAVPTMLAATGFDLFRSGPMMSLADGGILAGGFVSAFVVAMLTI